MAHKTSAQERKAWARKENENAGEVEVEGGAGKHRSYLDGDPDPYDTGEAIEVGTDDRPWWEGEESNEHAGDIVKDSLIRRKREFGQPWLSVLRLKGIHYIMIEESGWGIIALLEPRYALETENEIIATVVVE